MTPVFADTAALIALGDKSDKFHYQAIAIMNRLKKLQTTIVTTDAVISDYRISVK